MEWAAAAVFIVFMLLAGDSEEKNDVHVCVFSACTQTTNGPAEPSPEPEDAPVLLSPLTQSAPDR